MNDQVARWADGIEQKTITAEDIPPRERDAVQIELLRRGRVKAALRKAEKLGKAS